MCYCTEISVMCIRDFSFLEAVPLLQNLGWAVSEEDEEKARKTKFFDAKAGVVVFLVLILMF